MTWFLEALEVFVGDLSPNRAEVHAWLAPGESPDGYSLAGFVRGPRCSRGSTLPATYRLVGQPARRAACVADATALITEPVFWSPGWPALYDVTVQLWQGKELVDQTMRTIGLRPLAMAGKNLTYAGKTWVLRGVQPRCPLAAALGACAEHSAALIAPAELIDWHVLGQASELGVLTVVLLTNSDVAEEIRHCSQYAAVAIGVLPPNSPPFRTPHGQNLLLAYHLRQGDKEPPVDDVHLVMGEVLDENSFASWAATLKRAVIAYRELSEPQDIAAARAECDRLQADLAPYGQFAGYIV